MVSLVRAIHVIIHVVQQGFRVRFSSEALSKRMLHTVRLPARWYCNLLQAIRMVVFWMRGRME